MTYQSLNSYSFAQNFAFKILNRFKTILFLIIFTGVGLNAIGQGHPATDDEFVGPFNSWINVKTQFGAVGNGVADETAALQAAFNAVGNTNSTASVVYLPPGTYRITGTLTMNAKMNIAVIGADPATTKLIWAGVTGGIMFQINGTAYSRFNRIAFDGDNIAAIAVDQSWNGTSGYFDTGNEFADDFFSNVGIGIRGGFLGYGFAETAIMRCRFLSNTTAGISLGNFNALDVWVWHSLFENCKVGLTNDNTTGSAGNFKVYNSIFRNSTTSDIVIGNTGEFSFRDNTSTNSQMFLKASAKNYPAHITLQSNKILDPIASVAIDIRNQGPVVLIDNIIRSRATATAPIVFHATNTSSELFSMGNTFTVSSAISTNSRNSLYDNAVVARTSLSSLTEQSLPGTQPNLNRQILEVPLGSDVAAIQVIINQAALLNGTRPVVHFPHGKYNIESTLNIPANTDMQLVGDGDGDSNPTWLWWTGNTEGPVLNIKGPSKVTIRDISFYGKNIATNILIKNVDQQDARVFLHQAEIHLNKSNLFVNGLDNAKVLAQNSRFSASTIKSINVIGGPSSLAGNTTSARTIIYGGLGWENSVSHEVSNGGNLLVRDVWYESLNNGNYANLPNSGTFVADGSHVTSPRNSLIPQINISNFSGKATLLNTYLQDTVSISGNGTNTKFLGLGVVFSDAESVVITPSPSYIKNTTSPAADVRSFHSRSWNNPNLVFPRSGSYAVSNTGVSDSAFIAGMIASARDVHAEVLTALPSGVSDVRLFRVWSYYGAQGIEIQAATSLPTDHFRTITSGNWNSSTIWESSVDNISWYAATLSPDHNASTITLRHNVNLTSNITIDQSIINTGDTLFVEPNIVLTVNDGTGTDLTISSGANVTLRSTNTGTAMIGNSSGSVEGDVTVERFISSAYARSAWRLLTAPLKSTTGTNASIFNHWQNKGVNQIGKGTLVTAPSYNGSNGIDAHTPGASMKWFDGTNLQSVTTTNNSTVTPLFNTATSAANNSFFIFIRGDRITAINSSGTTTLAATGSLQLGDQIFSTNTGANKFTLIGNPYASPVDLDLFRRDNNLSNIKSTYYYWDPYLSGTYGAGGYVTVSYDGTGSSYTIIPSSADHTRYLQSGQAMFVETNTNASGTPAITFKESQKVTTNINNVFRTQGLPIESIAVNLNVVTREKTILLDATVTKFDNSYSSLIDNYDATKFYNIGENISFKRNDKNLSIERRTAIDKDDILFINLSNLKEENNYQFEIVIDINLSGNIIYLHDNYLSTSTQLNQAGKTLINFKVDNDPASKSSNRFTISFAKPQLPVSITKGITVYPNPVINGLININFNQMMQGQYLIRLFNSQGQQVFQKAFNYVQGSKLEPLQINKSIKGLCHLQIINADKSFNYSEKLVLN